MKYVTIAAVVAILLAGAIAEGEQAQGAAQAEKTRVAKSTGKPIAEQVRPDDQRVVLEINALPPLLVNPPKGQSQLEFMTDVSQLVLVVRAESKRAELTDRANWVRSNVDARVERVLKANEGLPISAGSLVTIPEDGGTVQMGRTTVEAVVPWEKRMAVGRRYLVFGIVHEGQIVAASAGIYEEVDRNTLRRLMQRQDPSERDEIETLNLDQVMILVEARKANAEAGKGK